MSTDNDTAAKPDALRVSVYGGKYTIVQAAEGGLRALRYGEEWRDCNGDGMVLALAQKVDDLRGQRTALVDALTATTATIGAIYQWLEMVEAAGGAKSIAGIAKCHAMLTSLRENAARTETLVMAPARAALAKAGGAG